MTSNILSLSLVAIASFVLSTTVSAANKPKASAVKAGKHLSMHHYAIAADMYETLCKKKDFSRLEKQAFAFASGEAYRLNHDTKNALKMYSYAIRYGMTDSIAQFRKGEMLMSQAQYTEALALFKGYKRNYPADPDVDRKIVGCLLGLACHSDNQVR